MHNHTQKPHVKTQKKLLLMGLPNVGKSAIFSRLTGLDVMVSNYSGTTVEFTEGPSRFDHETYRLIDVPGVYNIQKSHDDAEAIAIKMLNDNPEGIIFVLDAMNLEPSLHLLLQVLEYDIPTIVALNRNDLSTHRGIKIDHELIARRLNVPVVPTIALLGDSLELLREKTSVLLNHPKTNHLKVPDENERWKTVEVLLKRAVMYPKPNGKETQQASFLVKPFPGIPIALLILGLVFGFVIGFGMGLRQWILLPFFDGLIFPWIELWVHRLIESPMLVEMLIGEYGFLIKGIEWPFALVLPYVVSFYIMMSILEDTGYLPRLAVLLDGMFKKIGLTGSSVIPLLLGYGCGIPAIMATRSLPSKKSRLSVAVMVSFAIPCVSQTGAFIALLVEYSLLALIMVFAVSIIALMIVGFVMDKIQPKAMPFTLMELPPLLVPTPKIIAKKIFLRIKHYIKDGAVPMIIAIFFTAIFYELGALSYLGERLSPLVSGWLRLPTEASTPLLLGVIRRELAVLPLIDMNLTTLQFFTASVVALFYVPCIAMIATLAKEFNIKTAIGVLLFTTFTALFLGGLIARIGALFL